MQQPLTSRCLYQTNGLGVLDSFAIGWPHGLKPEDPGHAVCALFLLLLIPLPSSDSPFAGSGNCRRHRSMDRLLPLAEVSVDLRDKKTPCLAYAMTDGMRWNLSPACHLKHPARSESYKTRDYFFVYVRFKLTKLGILAGQDRCLGGLGLMLQCSLQYE